MTDEKLIRKRKSYTDWFDWVHFLVNVSARGILPTDIRKILDKVWQDIEDRHGFGSEYNSAASMESLELAYADYYNLGCNLASGYHAP